MVDQRVFRSWLIAAALLGARTAWAGPINFPMNGMVVYTQDGSVDSIVIGKDELVGAFPQLEAQQIPEPAAWLVWAGLAGGMAWRYRRSRRSRS